MRPASPKDVSCPTCQAAPGSPCKRPSGHRVFGGAYHAPRERAFEAAVRGPIMRSEGRRIY